MKETKVLIFDFMSHAFMHLPFNEGYIRLVRFAFPEAAILFHASSEHVAQLSPLLAGIEQLEFIPCQPMAMPFGLSRHNPLAGSYAARQCFNRVVEASESAQLAMIAVLGVDAALLSVLRSRWPNVSSAPLQMILHNQLGEASQWRSRNPVVRAFDFISQLRRPLPSAIKLVALELGIEDAIAEIGPLIKDSLQTLEHPILASQWIEAKLPVAVGPRLRVGFLGHASFNKGFDKFVDMARKAPQDKEFHSIGIGSPEALAMDLRALVRRPSKFSVPRSEYLDALRDIDIVCLPLSRGYDFVASGSVIDAIAGLKPIFSLRNKSVEGMFKKYGSIGQLFDTQEELEECVLRLTPTDLARRLPEWQRNLSEVRIARLPERLAPAYRNAVLG